MQIVVRLFLILMLFLSGLLSWQAWWLPVEVRQRVAAAAAPEGRYAASEAAGFAEAEWWLLRVAGPVLFLLAGIGLLRVRRVSVFVTGAARGFWAATTTDRTWRAWVLRGFLAIWLYTAVFNGQRAVVQRLLDWPSYRLYAGARSLPNISESNKQVIRYVESRTPEDARILVLSDQKLFFLSYYLLPRRLYHRLHPESEFVIPLSHGARPLAAYTRADLPPGYLEELQPDFVLEYFESDALVDPERVMEDVHWLKFLNQGREQQERPRIMVVLRPYVGEGAR